MGVENKKEEGGYPMSAFHKSETVRIVDEGVEGSTSKIVLSSIKGNCFVWLCGVCWTGHVLPDHVNRGIIE